MIKKWLLAGMTMTLLCLCACSGAAEPEKEENIQTENQERPEKFSEKDVSETETKDEGAADAEKSAADMEENQTRSFFEEFAAEDLDGNPVTQDIFKDYDLTMINLWATFCGPCINEMPDLGELHSTWKEKGVQVVGLCTDTVNLDGTYINENLETAKLIVEETGADYLHIVPAGEVAGRLLPQIQVVPTTVFVDKDGKQVTSIVTGSRTLEDWEEIIEILLEEMAK